MQHYDVIVIGAGAAGLMCARVAGQRGRRVLVLDHANKVGKKILMSGGGRCNFTNLYSGPDNFICRNPHFVKSALSRFTPADFIALVEQHGIPYHEKKLGQLFCDNKSRDIVNLLLDECAAVGAEVRTHCTIESVTPGAPQRLETSDGAFACESLVIATGGLSVPTMGATGFGYALAEQLGLRVWPTRAGLVPFTLDRERLAQFKDLSGVSLEARAEFDGTVFRENILFTHRGVSGPAVLQISSYWEPGRPVRFDLCPERDVAAELAEARGSRPRLELHNWLGEFLPKRVAQRWCELWLPDKPLGQLSNADIEQVVSHLQPWEWVPAGTEGYRTAEVTLGGVDTDAVSSKTFECKTQPGVYFIGEVLDVTGHLGGHNFQWAWASGNAAGLHA